MLKRKDFLLGSTSSSLILYSSLGKKLPVKMYIEFANCKLRLTCQTSLVLVLFMDKEEMLLI